MFGLGMPEILLILAIALIVIGPKKLPELAKTLGRAMGEFKRSAQDFKRSIDIDTTVTDIKDIETPPDNSLKKAVAATKKEATEDKNLQNTDTAPDDDAPENPETKIKIQNDQNEETASDKTQNGQSIDKSDKAVD